MKKECVVKHSKSKTAWKIVSTLPGDKYNIARVPYTLINNDILDTRAKAEAMEDALFIASCFNKTNI